jgi:two-component system nitrogen regulation sensor histidine kinase GlnL
LLEKFFKTLIDTGTFFDRCWSLFLAVNVAVSHLKINQMYMSLDYKIILDNLTTAIILADGNLRLVYMNSACEALLQISLNNTIGNSIQYFYHEVEDNENNTSLEKATATLKDDSLYTKRKARWRLANNEVITVDYTVTPLLESSQILFEIQPLDRLLQISKEEALIASQSTTRNLLRGLAHEVKNPLGGIRGSAQLLEKELEEISDDPGLKDYTNVIIAETDRLRNLVDRMLGPRHPIDFINVNIHEILERVISLIYAETKGSISLERSYDPSIPDIKGDFELLIQALLNVVSNATQALNSQPENSSKTITVTTRIQRQFTIGRKHYPLVACIIITDNGPGIPSDIIEDIFYPMISGRAEGTGLGLSISQQLINQHRGLIECVSEPGDTRFSIYIPLD